MSVIVLSCRKYVVMISKVIYIAFIFIICITDISISAEVPNVIIITLEGVRNQDSIGDPVHQYIPNLWFKMIKEGTFFTSVIDFNRQFHMPVVGCINSGKWQLSEQAILSPSIFQYARKLYRWPKEKTWMIGEWDNQSFYETSGYYLDTAPCRLKTLSIEPPPELVKILDDQEKLFFERYKKIERLPISFWPTWDSLNEIEQRMIKKVLKVFKPKLVHYVINATETAHFDDYGRYVISLKRADEMIFEIWRMVRDDPFYRDNTYLIVTPDHERNAYHMDHTENPIERPSVVWMYVYGPFIKKNTVIKNTIYRPDIFPTVATILGLQVEQGDGRVLKECFTDGFLERAGL